jgi:hypothetical protein
MLYRPDVRELLGHPACIVGLVADEVGVAAAAPVSVRVICAVALAVPDGTFLGVSPAVVEIVKVAVTVVSLTTPISLTVTPAPDTVTAGVPVRPLPVRVTETMVPRAPVAGLMPDRPP